MSKDGAVKAVMQLNEIQTGAELYTFMKEQLGEVKDDKNTYGSLQRVVDPIIKKLPEDCYVTRKGIEELHLEDQQAAYLMFQQTLRHRPKLLATAQQKTHGIGNILQQAVSISEGILPINIWPDWLDAENLVTRSLPSDGKQTDRIVCYQKPSNKCRHFTIEMATIDEVVIGTIEKDSVKADITFRPQIEIPEGSSLQDGKIEFTREDNTWRLRAGEDSLQLGEAGTRLLEELHRALDRFTAAGADDLLVQQLVTKVEKLGAREGGLQSLVDYLKSLLDERRTGIDKHVAFIREQGKINENGAVGRFPQAAINDLKTVAENDDTKQAEEAD
ncbi:hypothetical protein ACFL6C_14700 [Myxococcota bacterium]